MAITYNLSEAKKEKSPKVYQNFIYDNETNGGCINKFSEVSKLIGTVASDIETIGNKYSKLVNLYGSFTDYKSLMDTNKSSLRSSVDSIRKEVEKLSDMLKTSVTSFQKKDSSFMTDLEAINKLISNESLIRRGIDMTRKVNDANSNKRPAKTDTTNEAGFSPGTKVNGSLSPGTTQTTFEGKSYTIDKNSEEYRQLVATVYAEASERPEYHESDTLGVMSAILNRVENDGYPNSIYGVISEGNGSQFNGFKADNEKHKAAYNDMSVVPQETIDLIDRALAGERNTNAYSFVGDGVKNSFK